MKRLSIVASAFFLLQIHGQVNADNLSDALSILPATIFTAPNTSPDSAVFVDVEVLLNEQKDGSANMGRRIALSNGHRTLQAYFMRPDAWSQHTGIGIERVRFLAGTTGQSGTASTVSALGLSAGTTEELMARLSKVGFTPLVSPKGYWANGEPEELHLNKIDLNNPWLGDVGMTSVVTAHKNTFFQSASPAHIESFITGKRADATPAGRLFAESFEHAPWKPLQALFFSPSVGIADSGIDPASVLIGESLTDTKALLEKQINEPVVGVPLYQGGMIADIAGTDAPSVVMLLAYPDCKTATEAVGKAVALWPKFKGEKVSGQTIKGEHDECAAVITASNDATNSDDDRPFRNTMGAMIRREFHAWRIGAQIR